MNKIKYKLGLYFSDRMYDDRDISFSILLPIEFNTEKKQSQVVAAFLLKWNIYMEKLL